MDIRNMESAPMNVYLDDVREGYNNGFTNSVVGWEDWVVVRHIDYVKTLLKHKLVNDLSLDHDMGKNSVTGKDNPSGKDLVNWMVENDCWPNGNITIHSENPIGAKNMKCLIDEYFYNQKKTV